MTVYEYRVLFITVTCGSGERDERINALAAEGWRLVDVAVDQFFTFERKKGDEHVEL